MQMLAIARVLGELLERHAQSSIDGKRDSRILVPGLTHSIAKDLHDYLVDHGINSYLVISEEEAPSENKRLIRAKGLTSKRIGSFIAIASPGQLVHIQDSIRGTGGTIRSMAFSEEWPWIDNGNESFRFDGPILDNLVRFWSSDIEKQRWLREFTLNGLLRYTRTSSHRGQLFLEGILGTFDPSLYPEITDVREKLLFHSGVPRPTGGIPMATKLIQSSTRLCQNIIGRCQTDEDVRGQVRDMVMVLESIPDNEKDGVKFSVDSLLDGIGRSSTTDLGLLGFYSCWGQDKADSIHWLRLDNDRLGELFNVKEREKAEVSYDLTCERAVIAKDHKKLATFIGEPLEIEISYQIPEDQFPGHVWKVCVLNRQKVVDQQVLNVDHGGIHLSINTANITERYSRKIPLRIALLKDSSVESDAKLDMHLCGEDRPAFVIVEPGFEVVDATTHDAEEILDKKINIDDPIHVFMLSHATSDVTMYNEDEASLDVIETGKHGIWRSGQSVDISIEPSGQAIRVCKFENLSAVLCFEAKDLEKGEFTLEDELRVTIPSSRGERLKELAALFEGNSREPYPALGRVDDAARRRIAIATLMTSRIGWRPLLTNLLEPARRAAGSLGDFINHLGNVDGEAFNTLTLPEEALLLLKAYSDSRDAVRQEIECRLDSSGLSLEHPVYATHPIFSHERSRQTEQLLYDYAAAYCGILDYLESKQKDLEWLQLFVLNHLDCAVHWDSSRLRNALFLVGPWHPVVLAKRYMLQAALFFRAHRFLHKEDGKAFKRLSSLLGRVQGFRWLLGLSADDRLLEPVYILTTSDPGWHLAFKMNVPSLSMEEGLGGLAGTLEKLQSNFGLSTEIGAGGSENLAVTCLSSYLRAFPSRRSIGMRVRRGYAEGSILTAIDRHLHAEEGPTEQGRQLPGGVRMYFEEPVGDTGEVKLAGPPLYIYTFEDDAECVKEEHPDIYMLPPMNDLSFKDGRERYRFPRGTGLQAIFSQSLNWLTEGQTLVPKSITYEFDVCSSSVEGIGGVFIRAMGKVAHILGDSLITVRSVDLPQRLDAPWVVIPGEGVDPAVLVKYVRDGADRAIQERALWDYKLDIANNENSFFILSPIPKGFQIAINGFFGKENVASSFIVELGRIGIAIGGEALKSGRHALGVIGVIGAVRLFQGTGRMEPPPLACTSRAVGFLVPVDSFSSFFGESGSSDADIDGKRTDLLAIRIVLPHDNSGRVTISCCGIESKFTSGTFGITRAHAALDQARATTLEFKKLVETSLLAGAMPERLALLELLKFGLRITSPSQPTETQAWIKTEAAIYDAILSGNYQYSDAEYNAVLVTTEEQLLGVAEHVILQEGMWIRLTRGHWPGISDTPQLDLIRRKLSELFNTSVEPTDFVKAEIERPLIEAALDLSPAIEKVPSEAVQIKNLQINESITNDLRESAGTEQIDEVFSLPVEGPLDRIFLGVDEGRRAIYFDPQSPVDPLDNTNLMVTGSSGTGKTQLLKYLICKIREQGKPVLILDFKNDFASDAAFSGHSALDRIFVAFDGLPYNPLIPYPVKHPETGELYVQCGQHIAGVTSVLRRTYALGAQQQAAVKNVMVTAFSSAGIFTSGSARYSEDMHFPDFSLVGNTLQHDNPAAYNRLDPLFTLGLFRDDFRNSSFQSLVGRSAILDLSQIPSDEIKNTLAQLVVLSAHAYYNSQPHSGTIRQVLVFDEAHRVLNSDYMLRLVRECRAYGVATVLSSQYPSDFPGEISASMATKVLHGNGSDSEKVKTIVQLIGCGGREGDVANLDRFQAFVDNRHYPHTLVRTMNYPLYLLWSKLQELGTATREELSQAKGIDTSKLPIGNLVRQLERLGLAEEREGRIFLLERA